MKKSNPLLALHEALSAALLRDLSDVQFETLDHAALRALQKLDAKTEERPMREVVVRPTDADVDVVMFSQLWMTTALGYGGLAGQSATQSYTVVVSTEREVCVYFRGGRLAYRIELESLSPEQRNDVLTRIYAHDMPTRAEALKRWNVTHMLEADADAE
jgi:hypothetical protein